MPAVCAVIVFHRENVLHSSTVQSLQRAFLAAPALARQLLICLYDNTPESVGLSPIPAGLFPSETLIFQPGVNGGLPLAYNQALRLAEEQSADWLLLLDSDTSVTPEFLSEAVKQSTLLARAQEIAAIVPHVVQDTAIHSPRYAGAWRRHPLPLHFAGIAPREIIALNSATLVRVAAVRSIGGFTDEFWLDYLDYWLFRTLQKRGFKIYVLAQQVEHSLSLARVGHEMTLSRYQNMLAAEQYFTTRYGSGWEQVRRQLALIAHAVRYAAKPVTRPFALAAARAVLRNCNGISRGVPQAD